MQTRDLSARLDEVTVVDVREPDEYAAGHLAGSTNVPLGELPGRVAGLDTSRTLVAVCRSGNRSGGAAEALGRAGIAAENLEGGLTAWERAGLPLVTADGRPGHVA